METAIWIALISALGVTLSSFIQWRSNRATLKASERREVAEREDRNKQVAADREHQRLMAAASDERARDQLKWEAGKALADTWRPKRAKAHEEALRAIEVYRQAMNSEKFGFLLSSIRKEPLSGDGKQVGPITKQLDAASSDVHTYGSENASNRFQEVRATLSTLQGVFMMKRLISNDTPVSADEMKRVEALMQKLDADIASYRKAAKADIGTES
ncbi:hypothetical protein [Arthrobacter cupressi]